MPGGGFHRSDAHQPENGLVLNIATGIAGAVIETAQVLDECMGLGENYGQWGRFLFMNKANGDWTWRPTSDGSVGLHDPRREVRFTELCGGPAVFKRYREKAQEDRSLLEELEAFVGSEKPDTIFSAGPHRNVELERTTLQAITKASLQNMGPARSFALEIAHQVGGALACLQDVLGQQRVGTKIVITGGVGEKFAAPQDPETDDFFIGEIARRVGNGNVSIMRSVVGLDAELVGCVYL